MKKVVEVYVHGSDEQLWDKGQKLGLTGEVLAMFSHACDEFKVTLEVDTETGLARLTHVDGRAVAKEEA